MAPQQLRKMKPIERLHILSFDLTAPVAQIKMPDGPVDPRRNDWEIVPNEDMLDFVLVAPETPALLPVTIPQLDHGVRAATGNHAVAGIQRRDAVGVAF